MALPTLTKTWEYDVNIAAITTESELLFQIKNRLVGAGATSFTTPWTVVSSSDGVTADNTDRWIDSGDIVFQNPGSAHSWIVLQNNAINTGFQIVLEARKTAGLNPQAWDMYVSEAAGFTGGTTTNRPTATDQVRPVEVSKTLLLANSNTLASEPARLHVQMANDGKVTRWMVYSANTLVHFVDIQVPSNTATNWTIPWVSTIAVQYDGSGVDATQTTYLKLAQKNPPNVVYSRAGSVLSPLFYTSEATVGTSTTEEFIGITQNFPSDLEADSCLPIMPIGLFSKTVGSRGRIGELVDLWWGAEVVGDGNHYPANATRTFVQLGNLVSPWNGGSQIKKI